MVSIRSVLRVTLTFTFDIVWRAAARALQPRQRPDSGRYVAALTLAKVVVGQHWITAGQ